MAQYPDAPRNTLSPSVHIASLVDQQRNAAIRLAALAVNLTESLGRLGVSVDGVPCAEKAGPVSPDALTGLRIALSDMEDYASQIEQCVKALDATLTPHPQAVGSGSGRAY